MSGVPVSFRAVVLSTQAQRRRSLVRKQLCRLLAAAWLVSILSALPARAGIGHWDPYGPPAGTVISFAVHPSGRLLIVAEEGHLYARAMESEVHASADGGRSWFWSGAGLGDERMRAVAVDPEDGDVYALGVTRFFRSTDGGITWAPFGSGLRGVLGNLIRDPRRPVLYTGGGGLFEISLFEIKMP